MGSLAACRFLRASLAIASLLALSSQAVHAAATDWVGDANAAFRLVTASDAAGDDGPIEAGLEFRYGAGWHGSWRDPGDAGLAPKADWTGSTGIRQATVAWPAPLRLTVGDLETYVYEGGVTLPVTLERGGDGPIRLHAVVRHAVCGEVCVPYRGEVSLTLPPGPATQSMEATAIAAARALAPGSPDAAGIVVETARLDGAPEHPRLTLDLRSAGAPFSRPDLFIEGLPRGAAPAPVTTLSDGGRAARLETSLAPFKGATPPGRLTLTVVDGDRAFETMLAPSSADAGGAAGFLAILATALAGGLILNLMPCALPVLSLKVFALARHSGGSDRSIRVGLLGVALGIVASFLAIASALVALKASGASVGWGIQFQHPWFLAGMAALTVVFAASLFDWVAIGLPGPLATLGSTRGRGPLSEAFLTGAFATLMATPCSAPFVGTAIGFALTRGAPEILAIFAALGLGMAAPYLGIALAPGLARALPRPGPWMARLKVGLGLLLLATAAWLVAILAALAGAASAGLTALALVLLLGWLALRRGATGRRASAAVAAALALATVGAASLPGAMSSPALETGAWSGFDPPAILALVGRGQVVVVDVTATWCLTCKINDVTTFAREPVRRRLDRPDVTRMRADWTRPDPAILAYLKSFGRFGIPLVVVYGPGLPQGEALPELLTPGRLLGAVERATSSSAEPAAGAPNSPRASNRAGTAAE